ncbi:hypothetical protein P280DRAFT_484278 [Massarina eburnea CBS 473.64]|uniref:Extracellular membrane protein CFEM domain-containing protein n=1 Tax=Massarina eburnea CBS 473.64 TaxID=1395130 RepID=A0A6A6RPE9_9PLEO|nr:hypothetical protein P280DRAFT_484278 [Massarina eburnea CBS 473.64]
MRLSSTIFLFALGLFSIVSAVTTSIFIDQIVAYSELPDCAQYQLSAIVRAQASGCGDNRQLTSFSCFCIEQSTMMASVISTAVQASCAAKETAMASITSPLPQVTQALDVFNSYCARSTELSLYQTSTTGQVTITAAPSSTSAIASATATPTSDTDANSGKVPVAAIAAPVIIGILAIAAVMCLLFWLRRRQVARKGGASEVNGAATSHTPPSYTQSGYEHFGPRRELADNAPAAEEAPSDIAKYRYELEDREFMEPVELEGGEVGGVAKGKMRNGAGGWPKEKI